MEERPGTQPYSVVELGRNRTVAPEPRPLWEAYVWTYLYSILTVVFSGELAAAVPSVKVNFNDTRCTDGGRVCPTDSLLFTCTANESTVFSLRVTLPSGYRLTLQSDSGTVSGIGGLPNGFSVESSNVVMNDGGDSFNYTLSLSITNATLLAGGMILCGSTTLIRYNATCSVVDSPLAPSGLEQVSSANTLTSAKITWQEPNNTGGGGVDITHYSVYTSLRSPVDISTLSHTLIGLEVETDYAVSVTATNECGLESTPSNDLIIRIPAGKPPAPTIRDPVVDCDVEYDDRKSPVNVTWTYVDPPSTPSPEGLVYPRITDVTVSYTDPVNMTTIIACDDLSGDDSSCSFYISLTVDENRPIVDVSVEVTNVVGSSVSQRTFELFKVVQEASLNANTQSPGVTITLNELCRDDDYIIVVNFGTQKSPQDNCMIVDDASLEMKLKPGHSYVFPLDTKKVPLEPDMIYCYYATIKGTAGTVDVGGSSGDGSSTDGSSGDAFPIYAIVIIVIVIVAFLVATVSIIIIAGGLIWKGKSRKQNMKVGPDDHEMKPQSTLNCESAGNNGTIDSHTHTTVDNTDTLGGHSTASQPMAYEVVSTARDRNESKTLYQSLSGATLQQNGPYQICSDWETTNTKGGGNMSENTKQHCSKLPLPYELVSTAKDRDEYKIMYQSLCEATLQRDGPYQARFDWVMTQKKGGGDKNENKKLHRSKLPLLCESASTPRDRDEHKTLYQSLSGATQQRDGPYQAHFDWGMTQHKGGGEKNESIKQNHSKLPQSLGRNVKSPNTVCGIEDASGVIEEGIYESCT